MATKGISTFSKKDNSPRGCKTVSASEIKVGDEIVIDNYFTLVTEQQIKVTFNGRNGGKSNGIYRT